jgi:hypothetical protein
MAKQESKKSVKLTEEEIKQLETTQVNRNKLLIELGQIKLAEITLEKRLENAENFLSELEQQESSVAKLLEDKYGNGSIDIKTGEFTAS